MAEIKCIVVTPEAKTLETSAEFVALPLDDGELGVAPKRTPLIGRLGYGEMRIRSSEGVQRYYIDGGFVRVAGDVVTVLTQRAVAAEKIDMDSVRQQLQVALHQPAASPEALVIRERKVRQARAELRVARHVQTS